MKLFFFSIFEKYFFFRVRLGYFFLKNIKKNCEEKKWYKYFFLIILGKKKYIKVC